MLNNFLNILFPESCPVCHKRSDKHETAPICSSCWKTITPYTGPSCRRCGKALVSIASSICGTCHKDTPQFDRAESFGLHEGALQKAISLFKFQKIKRLSIPLSEKFSLMEFPHVEMVLPVPLHKKRLKEREFNQSALLAKEIAKKLDALLMLNTLIRKKNTLPQVGLSAKERKKNIRNAFEVLDPQDVKGKRLILVDDVFTTGATAQECSKVLKKAGAKEIHVMTLTHGTLD
jgi:competence protein ComFC